MSNIQNKIAYFINFNKHNLLITYVLNKFYQKKEYVIIPIIPYPIGGILLHLKQNNLTNHSTGKKNITGKILNQKRIQKEKYKMKGETIITICVIA